MSNFLGEIFIPCLTYSYIYDKIFTIKKLKTFFQISPLYLQILIFIADLQQKESIEMNNKAKTYFIGSVVCVLLLSCILYLSINLLG
jgi:hypothetical protein